MRFRRLQAFLFALILLTTYSCTSYKNVPYFQDVKRDSLVVEQIKNYSPLTIQPGDLLGIHESSLNAEADNIINYNLIRTNGANVSELKSGSQNAVIGYLVSQQGEITVPMITVSARMVLLSSTVILCGNDEKSTSLT
jgi:polysaccharide export outer membrane protein